ncbi:uncharacterized protein K460DRAFT_136585 [Cucurbitaria berberidis CBS 394.84]|uniref:Uncharacterized protein n=1 Tax=Cucurbitaria berberidis CBS 394.84 TaxID=1168544 RepID=A0A9P4GBQ1_9PLEO|nr:uncharacterized protein K460DRAFT_136585 [Cucurbitaria berberidis CBS 394.84]KAF1842913.1 hypothetical protein K460DRAFT_136585 [Cucurbitaria berberidis CBS 394.84]
MPASSARNLSSRTLLILLETQQVLRKIELPVIEGPLDFRLQEFVGSAIRPPSLHSLDLTMKTRSDVTNEHVQLIRRSTNTAQAHLRLHSAPTTDGHDIGRSLAPASFVSNITRLTFHECKFGYTSLYLQSTLFPAVRALALVDCIEWDGFFVSKPENFLALRALMVRGG